jgi:DNA-binding SARP family transcriptional activator/TolB-like protein/Flp pilus assembly protein TadD
MQNHVSIRLLGGFDVASGASAQPIQISSPRQRALLAYLALRPDYSESRERLATLLWGDCTDGQARKRFRQSLLRLRREFANCGIDPLVVDRDRLALDATMVRVDAHEFLELSQGGTEAELDRAADLYRGDLLDGIGLEIEPFDEWLHQERSRFREVAAHVLERSARTRDQRGDAEKAISAAERLIALDAANETAQRQLIELLARHRGRSAALMRAEAVAQFVKDEFGCELEPETQELIAKIRATPSPTPPAKAPDPSSRMDTPQSPPLVAAADQAPSRTAPLPPRAMAVATRTWPAGVAALLALVAVVALVRTDTITQAGGSVAPSGMTMAQPPAPTVANAHVAAVSKALERSSDSAIIVLPFAPTPADAAPVARVADLVSNDLISNLARVPGFHVIARSTSIQYAKRPVDVGSLGADMGVDYAIEGDVRLQDGEIRINIALIDVKSRLRIWSERYQRDEADRLAVQDEIVRALSRQIQVTVMAARGHAASPSPSKNEKLGRAWAGLNLFAFFRGGEDGARLFEEVLRDDPDNISALTGLGAFKYAAVNTGRATEDVEAVLDQAERLLRRASTLSPEKSLPYYFLGQVSARRGSANEALALYQKVLEINPSYAPAYAAMGYVQMNTGEPTKAVENITYAMRLSPKDHYQGLWSQFLGRAYVELGDDAEAEHWLRQSATLMPDSPMSRLSLAAFLAARGDPAGAHEQAVMLRRLAPNVTSDDWIRTLTILCKEEKHRPARLIAGLRQAMTSVATTE